MMMKGLYIVLNEGTFVKSGRSVMPSSTPIISIITTTTITPMGV